LVADVDPSVELLVDDSLLPPQRFPGDHEGDPAFRRTPRQQASFERLLNSADSGRLTMQWRETPMTR
jgi:hypothetical protein